jgi:hypothetical protein
VSSHVPYCILPGALMTLMNHQHRSNTQDGVVHFCAMSVRSQPRLRVHIFFYHRKRISSSIASMIDPVWNLRKSLALELENVLFHSEYPLELLEQEDQVMKCNTSRVMKHHPVLQDAMSPMHRRKSCMGDQKVFLLSTVPLSFLGQCVFHHFLCSLLHKSQDEISFKRGGL